uniref:Uncharacterized protein n=1 Tax=Rhizophagus irregularis (strain DAOM 181602 / DAOM 197198 / MUCL 43194) TaxID=747089 RepID=U9U9H7_RHIID
MQSVVLSSCCRFGYPKEVIENTYICDDRDDNEKLELVTKIYRLNNQYAGINSCSAPAKKKNYLRITPYHACPPCLSDKTFAGVVLLWDAEGSASNSDGMFLLSKIFFVIPKF